MRNSSKLALVVVGLVACRGGGNNGDDQPTPDGNTNTDDVTIQEIQNDAMPACDPATPATCVELKIKGVVVTAIDKFGAKTGDFWVQEPGGGPYSGVHVYGAPLDQVGALALGDVVDIAGAQKSEFALTSDTSGNKLTELEPVEGGAMTVTKVMSGTPLQPQVVDAFAIGLMTDFHAREAEWEKWEGVLVVLNNVNTTTADTCVGTACSDDTLHKFGVTGDVLVESALSAMPTPTIVRDTCLASVTGVVDYFFDYQVLPRTTSEIATGGSACPPLENSPELCADGMDNDGNGFADCNDFTCQATQAACVTQTTIAQVQAGTATGLVQLDSVYVTSLSFSKKNLWVASSLTAAPNEGIYVFRGSGATALDAAMFGPGAKVTVKGTVQESNNDMTGDTLTQIGSNPTVTLVTAPATAPTAVTDQTASSLIAASTGEPYESVLVTLSNVKVNVLGVPCLNGATPPACSYGVGQLQQGTTTFASDDDILRVTDAVGTCYATITGIWTYLVFDNAYGLLPISTTAGGTCN
jgi:predicted extracellular nuclease